MILSRRHGDRRVCDLKPTQNAVGFNEVNGKIARYSAKSKDDLNDDYLLVHPVPVVIDNWLLKNKIREGDVLIGSLSAEHKKDIIDDEAIHLAKSPEAAGMPGYHGAGSVPIFILSLHEVCFYDRRDRTRCVEQLGSYSSLSFP